MLSRCLCTVLRNDGRPTLRRVLHHDSLICPFVLFFPPPCTLLSVKRKADWICVRRWWGCCFFIRRTMQDSVLVWMTEFISLSRVMLLCACFKDMCTLSLHVCSFGWVNSGMWGSVISVGIYSLAQSFSNGFICQSVNVHVYFFAVKWCRWFELS